MSFGKNGAINSDNIIESGLSDEFIPLNMAIFLGYNSGSISGPASDGKYTINSAVTANSWGAGFSIEQNKIILPYNCIYRIKMEVYVPSAHKIAVDVNNTVPSGVTIQGGNDNDNTALRINGTFSIPAKTWTEITWGSVNSHEKNTKHVDIAVYDCVGLITSGDSAATSWAMRNPRIFIGYNTKGNAAIDKNNIYSKYICEY